jgi:hypothetical protein
MKKEMSMKVSGFTKDLPYSLPAYNFNVRAQKLFKQKFYEI